MMQHRVLETPHPASAMPLPELYHRVERHVPPVEWPLLAEDIAAILALKREKNAVILAHNYQTPDIFHTVGDITGDSLALAREAERTDAAVIVLAGVHFMAETAKLLNPGKTVLIPDLEAGCSLADSITPADIRLMRQRYPGVPIVTYVNTSAAVKAESDICCTSGNAKKVVESLGTDRVIMLPDEYLAQNVAAESDFAGSTAAMIDYVDAEKPARVVLVTECSMSDNVAVGHPDIEFVR